MTAQRRTALFSVFAAVALIGLKLGVGLATGSLGLLSEAVHSGTDLIAALLTFFAVGVAVRPADPGHQYGHGKAEHLAALGEGAILVLASLAIVWRAIVRLTSSTPASVHARWYALVVVGGPFDAAVGQGHATADAVEESVQSVLPEADVVVHVEPRGDRADVRERAHAAALGVRRVREVHNVSVVSMDSGTEISLHLKLPGKLSLDEAHAVAEDVERAILAALPEVSSVQTHLEPLAEEAAGTRPRAAEVADERELVARIVRAELGAEPEDLRFVHTDEGLVAHLTVRLGARTALADAHAEASRIEELVRRERPDIVDVVVHTEPLE